MRILRKVARVLCGPVSEDAAAHAVLLSLIARGFAL